MAAEGGENGYKLEKDAEGYHPNFSLEKDSAEEILKFFKKYGFVIIRDVVARELVEGVVDDIWENYLPSNTHPELRREDPSTWRYMLPSPAFWPDAEQRERQDDKWYSTFGSKYNVKRGFLGSNMASSQATWDVRQHPNLHKAFSVILENRKLEVKLDRYGLMRPTKLHVPGEGGATAVEEHPEWRTEDRWVHWDQNPWLQPEFMGVQGILALSEHNEQTGGFHCIPGFVHEFKDWGARNIERKTKGSLVDMPKDDPAVDRLLRACMPKGSLLIWDSRTPHGNYPNDGFEWRMVMYVTMHEPLPRPPGRDLAADGYRLYLERQVENFDITPLGARLIGLTEWDD